MKERITYIIRDHSKGGFDPSTLGLTDKSLSLSSLDAAKEHQITLALDELPQELGALLSNSHELHVRWSTSKSYEGIAPFVSRVGAGLHVFWTPLVEGGKAEQLCPLIKLLFGQGIKCTTVEESFTTPPILSGRFSHTASRQFFAHTSSLIDLVTYIRTSICSKSDSRCTQRARDLLKADYVDADWDSISHALSLKAYWDKAGTSDGSWKETHFLSGLGGANEGRKGSLEVGILMNEVPGKGEEEELRYSGFLTQVGKDDHASQTLFSFPSRHHPLSQETRSYTVQFNKPTGLHPTLAISIPQKSLSPPSEDCRLHTYLTLPSSLFIDRYPLEDPLFLANHHLKALHSLSGATDLEAPDWVVGEWGSAALFELDAPITAKDDQFTATIPLHLRYLPPSSSANSTHVSTNAGKANVLVPWPHLFYVCPASESSAQFPSSPFDRTNLGYEGLFGPKTMFYHFSPKLAPNADAVELLKVPVLDLDHWATRYVEMATMFVVFGGALWISWLLVKVLVGDFGTRVKKLGATNVKKNEKKQK